MRQVRRAELPPSRQPAHRRAVILAWVTLAYLGSVCVLMYLVMGSSQAMRAAWLEDILGLIPPAAFLISTYFRDRPPDEDYPYGYHRGVSIAFLVAAVAILAVGGFLLFESAAKLVKAEHPTIGSVELFGRQVWLGWLMLPVLVYAAVPAVLLGRAKMGPARALHDKTLHADAVMNRADWLTATAAFVGVLGIAVGWWWADAAAALVISLDVVRDGVKNVRLAVGDLMDRAPRTVDGRQREALPARLATELKQLRWVKDAEVRLREDGHVFIGEAFLTPTGAGDPAARVKEALDVAERLDWRLQDLTVQIGDPGRDRGGEGEGEPK